MKEDVYIYICKNKSEKLNKDPREINGESHISW